jgi:hypothetical protein
MKSPANGADLRIPNGEQSGSRPGVFSTVDESRAPICQPEVPDARSISHHVGKVAIHSGKMDFAPGWT